MLAHRTTSQAGAGERLSEDVPVGRRARQPLGGGRALEELAAAVDLGVGVAGGEETEGADRDNAARQDVEEEAAKQCERITRAYLLSPALPGILPRAADLSVVDLQPAMLGDGHPVGGAPQGRDGTQGGGHGLPQEVVHDGRVVSSQGSKGLREGEDDLARDDGEPLLLTSSDPAGLGQGLARGPMAVTAGVVRGVRVTAVGSVTRIEMAAAGGGAAPADGPQHRRLPQGEGCPIRREASGAREADNIGDFEPGSGQKTPSGVWRLREAVTRAGRSDDRGWRARQGRGHGTQTRMAQHKLAGAEVGARFQPMRGTGMAQGVRGDVRAETCRLAGLATHLSEGAAGQRTRGRRPRKEPAGGPNRLPGIAQQGAPCGGEHAVAVFRALALADADDHALGIDGSHWQAPGFGETQPGGVGGGEGHPVRAMGDGGQALTHFGETQDDGERLLLSGKRDVGDGPILAKGDAGEKTSGTEGLVQAAPGRLLLVDQGELGSSKVFRAQQGGGRAAMPGRERATLHREFLCFRRVVAQWQVFERALT